MRGLFAVGIRGPAPRVAGVEAVVLPLHRLEEAGQARRDGTLLLIGPDVVERIPPKRVQEFLHFPYVIAALLPVREGLPSSRPWAVAGIEVLPTGPKRQRRLETLLSLGARVEIKPSYWIPPGVEGDPILARAVTLIPGLRRPNVVNLTAEMARERHYLGPRCKCVLGLEAREVCKRYVVIYCWLERARKVPWNHLAAVLGYPNPSNLRAAVHASRWLAGPRKPPPPPDPPDPPRPTPDSPSDAPDSPSGAPNSPLTRL